MFFILFLSLAKIDNCILKKRPNHRDDNSDSNSADDEGAAGDQGTTLQSRLDRIQKVNVQPGRDNRSKPNRYALQFHRETDKELRKLKEDAYKPTHMLCDSEQETDTTYFEPFDFPVRPTWSYSMSKVELDQRENRYFTEYITGIERKFTESNQNLNYFELNLETWRQLWRVLEISDIVLTIVDIRYPTLMFPPFLYEYVTRTLKKDLILVLNKIDLAPPHIVLAWKKYFTDNYPDLRIVLFTSFPSYNLRGNSETQQGLKIRRRRGKQKMVAEGAAQVLRICREIVNGEVDLSSWEQKIIEESTQEVDIDDDEKVVVGSETKPESLEYEEHQRYLNGTLTIGCVGFPNVGKSSLLNALMGRKVVSVSRTPGHTKHFQTIFLTENVRLCDCPGLVFPSTTPRKLQVLMGSYPIAQLREPYASVRFLTERLDLINLLNLRREAAEAGVWSAMDVCEWWAKQRGFLTAKAARPDTFRAANSILRMALDGKLSLCLRPPGFGDNIDQWLNHPELEEIKSFQALGKPEGGQDEAHNFESSSEEDGDDDGVDNDEPAGHIPVTRNAFALLDDE